MAYSSSNPPRLIDQDIGNSGQAEWALSGTDALTVVDTTGYISNAKSLGMKAGDLVTYRKTDTNATSKHIVLTINADGSADLSDGTVFTLTNTD